MRPPSEKALTSAHSIAANHQCEKAILWIAQLVLSALHDGKQVELADAVVTRSYGTFGATVQVSLLKFGQSDETGYRLAGPSWAASRHIASSAKGGRRKQ